MRGEKLYQTKWYMLKVSMHLNEICVRGVDMVVNRYIVASREDRKWLEGETREWEMIEINSSNDEKQSMICAMSRKFEKLSKVTRIQNWMELFGNRMLGIVLVNVKIAGNSWEVVAAWVITVWESVRNWENGTASEEDGGERYYAIDVEENKFGFRKFKSNIR